MQASPSLSPRPLPQRLGRSYRPGEAEGEPDGVAERRFAAAGGAAVGDAERVGSKNRRDGTAVGTRRLWGHASLVVLKAHAEESFAVALLQASRSAGIGGAQALSAAVAVAQKPLLIDKLLQLQLEDAGGPNLRRRAGVCGGKGGNVIRLEGLGAARVVQGQRRTRTRNRLEGAGQMDQ